MTATCLRISVACGALLCGCSKPTPDPPPPALSTELVVAAPHALGARAASAVEPPAAAEGALEAPLTPDGDTHAPHEPESEDDGPEPPGPRFEQPPRDAGALPL